MLKRYILRGHAVNDDRMKQLGQVIRLLKRAEADLDSSQILNVVSSYTKAIKLLTDYDHEEIDKPEGRHTICNLTYEECRNIINQVRQSQNSRW